MICGVSEIKSCKWFGIILTELCNTNFASSRVIHIYFTKTIGLNTINVIMKISDDVMDISLWNNKWIYNAQIS